MNYTHQNIYLSEAPRPQGVETESPSRLSVFRVLFESTLERDLKGVNLDYIVVVVIKSARIYRRGLHCTWQPSHRTPCHSSLSASQD